MIDWNRGDNLKCQVTAEDNSWFEGKSESPERVPDRN